MNNTKVVIAFVAESSDLTERHWLNRYAASLAPGETDARDNIIHCECFFPRADTRVSSKQTGQAYGIYFGGAVWRHDEKQYSNSDYIFKTVTLTPVQKKNMLQFLDKQVGKRFNHLGYASFLTPCKISGNLPGFERRFYCSQLTMAALNHSGVFAQNNMPENIHPHRVFELLNEISTVCSHPVRHVDYSSLTF